MPWDLRNRASLSPQLRELWRPSSSQRELQNNVQHSQHRKRIAERLVHHVPEVKHLLRPGKEQHTLRQRRFFSRGVNGPLEFAIARRHKSKEALDRTDGVAPQDRDSDARLLRFEISASSFCHQMVRSVVAALVDVGRGKGNAAALLERLRAASRQSMPEPAPAAGLCLVSVDYSGERLPNW